MPAGQARVRRNLVNALTKQSGFECSAARSNLICGSHDTVLEAVKCKKNIDFLPKSTMGFLLPSGLGDRGGGRIFVFRGAPAQTPNTLNNVDFSLAFN